MPLLSIELARPVRASGSKWVRGCFGLGLINPTGSSRRSPTSGLATLSGRIAARPRPMPRLGALPPFAALATPRQLLGERPVGDGPTRGGGMLGHGHTVARRLGDPDAARYDRVEDHLGEMLAQLLLDVA